MATRTLNQLTADVRDLANVDSNLFITDAQIQKWIQEGVGEEYDLVVSTGEHYYNQRFNFTLVGGQSGNSQSLSALTGGFYKDNTLELNPGTSNMRLVRGLGAMLERDFAPGITYEVLGTPPTLFVYPPELSKGDYCLLYTPDAPVLTTTSPAGDLDATLTRWYQYPVIYAAIQVHRRRGKLDEAQLLAGVEGQPQPGTLAYMKQRILTMAHNKKESAQQVPMARPAWRSSFWNDGSQGN